MKKWVTKSSIWVLLVAIIVLFLLAATITITSKMQIQMLIRRTKTALLLLSKLAWLGRISKTACIIIAEELGYYDEEGIDVHFGEDL